MVTKQGVIQDVRYEADSGGCVIHVNCEDSAHTFTLAKDAVEKHGYKKGQTVRVRHGENGVSLAD